MRGFCRAGLVCLVLTIFFLPGVAAWNVTDVSIDPSGSLTPGTPVIVSLKIDFPDQPAPHQPHAIRLVTDLEKQKWTHHYITEGYEDRTLYSGKEHTLDEFPIKDLSAIRITLEGTAPGVNQTSNVTILRVEELDEKGNVVPGTTHEYTTMVINTCCIRPVLPDKKAELYTFRSHIDEKAAMGINTSTAEVKYAEAKKIIDDAGAMPSTQYADAMNNLNNASLSISDGERLLDKAWAKREIVDAQVPLQNADWMIGLLKGSKSTADLPALSAIITKREIAASYLSTAEDEIVNGNYAQARTKAHEAYLKANESYYDALTVSRTMIHGDTACELFGPDNPGCIIDTYEVPVTAGIVTICIVALPIAGFFWWKKRNA